MGQEQELSSSAELKRMRPGHSRVGHLGGLILGSAEACSTEDRGPHWPFASGVSFGKLLFPRNRNFFIYKVIIMVTIIKCSSK